MIEIHQFPCLSDNYGFLIHDSLSGETAAIDTPDAEAYLREAAAKGWQITQVWNTHWHPDHAGGNAAIKAACQESGGDCTVSGPAEVAKISAPDRVVAHGDQVTLGAFTAQVIDVGGHTSGHVAFYLPAAGVAFVGDALFALGCGRMFEGTAPQFWDSLQRLKALPTDTLMYCAHEYTESNARFAIHADPDNAALADYVADVAKARARGQATVPFSLSRELTTNPFLRADDSAIQARWGSNAVSAFAALREAKNTF